MQVTDVRRTKEQLRRKYKAIRSTMDLNERIYMDAKIHLEVLSFKEKMNFSDVFTYVSKNFEVDTIHIIKSFLDMGTRVAVPRCIPEQKQLDFFFIGSLDDLSAGKFGILEPNEKKCERILKFRKGSLCIVPGLSFDVHGFRLGYGGGYYDRFVNKFEGYTAGLCYSNCVRNEVPREKFDMQVNFLITDKSTRKIS